MKHLPLLACVFSLIFTCCNNPAQQGDPVKVWITKADQSALLELQNQDIRFQPATQDSGIVIKVDTTQKFQEIDGFGYTVTGGSARMINQMSATAKQKLLQELFGDKDGIQVSYIRISIGASDLNDHAFSYDDVPSGQTDLSLSHFSLAPDMANGTGLIPLLKEIIAIRPGIKILGSPWSPPVWMKDNGNSIGGSLKKEYYPVYADYFVKYLQAMEAEGVHLDAITIQNEPLHDGNNPSLKMVAEDQRDFVKNNLGPAFEKAGIKTKIIVYDHNLDKPDYPVTILADTAAAKYVDGSAFHLYAGDESAMSKVHEAYPNKNLYFTEQWTGSLTPFSKDLLWHTKHVMIGTLRNWSRIALAWNLASDSAYLPHTPGGCSQCKGALTITGDEVTRNVAYYTIAHASKFIPVGSVRVASNSDGPIHTVAFITPGGGKVLLAMNESKEAVKVDIQFKGQSIIYTFPAETILTFNW